MRVGPHRTHGLRRGLRANAVRSLHFARLLLAGWLRRGARRQCCRRRAVDSDWFRNVAPAGREPAPSTALTARARRLVGWDIEFVERVAEYANVEINFTDMLFQTALQLGERAACDGQRRPWRPTKRARAM